jgi:hypothetical protein
LSVTATQVLTLRQETEPTSFVVSDVTVDQEAPRSAVPVSVLTEPAPAAQQFRVVAQETELSQPLSGRTSTRRQEAPPERTGQRPVLLHSPGQDQGPARRRGQVPGQLADLRLQPLQRHPGRLHRGRGHLSRRRDGSEDRARPCLTFLRRQGAGVMGFPQRRPPAVHPGRTGSSCL